MADSAVNSETQETTAPIQGQLRAQHTKSQQKIWHDRYELLPSTGKKNVGIDGRAPKLEQYDHRHFFHTVDSRGRKQTTSAPLAGHFHVMELVTPASADGKTAAVYKCSPPLKYVRKRDHMTGQWKREVAPATQYDNHTHDVVLRESNEIEPRKINMEAQKFITAESLKGQSSSKDEFYES